MIKSVGDFLNIVNELYPKSGEAFFRGQPPKSLSSSLCRYFDDNYDGNCDDNYHRKIIARELFVNFTERLPVYPESYFLKNYSYNEIDMLMTAQHYGIPTRLIDFSRNPLVALYFAAENTSNNDVISVLMLKDGFKILSSNSILKGVKCDYDAFNEIQHRINEIYDSIIIELEFNEISKEKAAKIIAKSKDEISKILINETKNTGAVNFFGFGRNNREDIFELSKYIISTLQELIEDVKKEGVDNIFENTMSEISEIIGRRIEEHRNGLESISFLYNELLIVQPLPINNRIKNQQGFFLFSKEIDEPELTGEYFLINNNIVNSASDINDKIKESCIVRIDIKGVSSKEIIEELSRYGVSKSFIYPELSYLAEEQKNMMSSRLG